MSCRKTIVRLVPLVFEQLAYFKRCIDRKSYENHAPVSRKSYKNHAWDKIFFSTASLSRYLWRRYSQIARIEKQLKMLPDVITASQSIVEAVNQLWNKSQEVHLKLNGTELCSILCMLVLYRLSLG